MDNYLVVRIVLFVLMTGTGALMVWSAQAAASGRLKRNPTIGIRVATTMASDEAWLAAHVRAARSTTWGGCVAIASGFVALLPLPAPVLAAIILGGGMAMLTFVIYGARQGVRAAKTHAEPQA